MKLEVPERFGDYRRLYSLGQGLMGETFLAERADGANDERVAVKVCFPDLSKKLKGASKMMSKVPDRRLIRYLEIEPGVDYECYLITHYFNIEPSHRENFKDCGLEEIVEYYIEACEALEALHKIGVFHGNLKPENVQVRKREKKLEPLILDVGLRYLYNEVFHDFDALKSILPYMAPEVMEPFLAAESKKTLPATAASDVYSLACCLCHSLTGLTPFTDCDEETVDEIRESKQHREYQVVIKNDPTTVLDVEALNSTLQRCMHAKQEERIPGMASLRGALEKCLGREPGQSEQESEKTD